MNLIAETHIGDVTPANQVALAPMAGVSDRTYRRLAKEQGVGFVCTEMISAKGLIYHNDKTLAMLRPSPDEHPVAVQLFGSDPSVMAEAAQMTAAAGADVIDINMGCPVQKVVKNGEGSALLKTPARAAAIVRAMTAATRVPITAKIRLGWDDASRNAVYMARLLEDAGVAALTVHGRTREQLYRGTADWDAIAAVAAAVRIPVWGNGDIADGPTAARRLRESGCAGIAVGRAAQGNPFVFREIVGYLRDGVAPPPVTAQERIAMCLRHLHLLAQDKGEAVAVREMRTHVVGYLRGLYGATGVRRTLMPLVTVAAWEDVLGAYLESPAQEVAGSCIDVRE